MQRIDNPRNRRGQNTRAAILDATLRLFEATRAQLVMALFDHVDERFDLASSIRPVQEAPDAASALHAWARHVARYHHPLAPLIAATERVAHEDPDVRTLGEGPRV